MLSVKKYKRKTRSVLLLQVYAKYKRKFLNPGVNKQEVWRKIAREMKEKGSFDYSESEWCHKVAELKWDYEKIKYTPATSREMVDFKIAAKNAFENIENPVPVNYSTPEIPLKKYERKTKSVLLLQVYAKYKREFLESGVNKQMVWRKIAFQLKEKGSFDYDESYWCSKLEELRQDYERIKYIPATDGEMIDFKIAAQNAFQGERINFKISAVQNIEHPVTAAPYKVKMAGLAQKQFKNYRLLEKKNIALLTLYRLHKAEFFILANAENVWKKIADEMNEKFPRCSYTPENCHAKLLFMKKLYEKTKDTNAGEVNSSRGAIFLKLAKLAFKKPKENPDIQNDPERSNYNITKRLMQIASLKAFSAYKAEFLSPDANTEKLWQKITEAANKLSLRKKPYDVPNFRNHLCTLKSNYDNVKCSKTAINTPEDAIFFKEAKFAFESTGSEAISIDQILHNEHSAVVKLKFERDLALLRAYNIYKTEFSSPNEDDESVWEKIAGTVRISCSLDDLTVDSCRLQLSLRKEKYENKNQDWYPYPEADILFEEEKLAFEPVEYPEEHEQMDLLTDIRTESV